MAEGEVTRRLAAIVAADVAGYSRLMAADEEATLTALRAHRVELIDLKIGKFNGRIANTAGDSILIEFPSVVDALRCVIDVQRSMAERNAEVSEDRRIEFRIGVHVGDVMAQDGDLLGDGVNVAARLEGLAEPGGIRLSDDAYRQVRDRVTVDFEDLGAQRLKNLPQPVGVYRVLLASEGAATSSVAGGHRSRRVIPALAVIVVIVAVISSGLWWWQQRTTIKATDAAKTAVSLPRQPSIAVLPFDNLSADPDQNYFADGITEDITTDLSKVAGILVTSRAATLGYRGAAIDHAQISTALRVRYLLQGSVRQAEGRVRLTAQLVDATTGTQVWAERYDRDLGDVFAIQDDVAERVVAALSVMLKEGSLRRAVRKYTPKIEAYDLYIRGRAKRIPPTPDNLATALALFEKAIGIDPKFSGGYAGAAYVHVLRYGDSTVPPSSRDDYLETALRLATQAVELDPTFGPGWGSLAEARYRKREFDQALTAIQRAIAEAPSDSLMRAMYGRLLGYAGRPEDGIEQVNLAMRMSPDSLPLLFFLGANYRAAGRFEKAIEALIEHRQRLGGRVLPAPTLQLAAAYMQAERGQEARATVDALLKKSPHLDLEWAVRMHAYKDRRDEARFLEALRKAGLPPPETTR